MRVDIMLELTCTADGVAVALFGTASTNRELLPQELTKKVTAAAETER